MGDGSDVEEKPLATGAEDFPTLSPMPSSSVVCAVCTMARPVATPTLA